MNSAKAVDQMIAKLKAEAMDVNQRAWQIALACVGWPYVFGAWGAECTVSERKKRYRDAHPTIRTACKAYDGGSCSGCKWFPGGERVRCYDCRGFTDWVLKQAGIIDLVGEGATSQWNTASNWESKGTVAEGIPQGVVVCLFYPDKNNSKTMAHTGLYFNGETCECSSGVQHFTSLNKKWTHWAIPKGAGSGTKPEPAPTPAPEPVPATKPTLRKGSKGEYVTLAQTMLINRGYSLPKYGADGDFGSETEKAVKLFQQDWNLTADGVIGPQTWQMLESSPARAKTYSITIKGLDATQARALQNNYPGSVVKEE